MTVKRTMKSIIFTALAAALLCGCSLAKEESETGKAQSQDKLVGALVTTQELFVDDGTDRLYATVVDDGGYDTYEFSNVYGFALLGTKSSGENGEPYTNFTTTGDGLSGVKFAAGAVTEMEATLYVTPSELTVFYLNPVYQQADGRLYAQNGGTGTGMGGGEYIDGMSMTKTIDETYIETEDGESVTTGTRVKLNIVTRRMPQSAEALYMGPDDALLSREMLDLTDLPVAITPPSGAEYIILVESTVEYGGEETVLRKVYGKHDDYLSAFAPLDDIVIAEHSIEINWR